MQAEGGYNHYNEARTKGKKEYGRLKAKGLSGHLTSLDGLLKDIDIVATVDLGVKEISLKKVVGTYYNARRMVFSKGFMPLESEMTEFGGKWIALCQAHLDEGIREPIKVYEYLNYYYVMEGNKRVSVLKYFDALSVMAQVYRLVPKYDEQDEDIVLYYAFMDFYKVTGLSDIWLSKAVRYERLLVYLEGYKPESEVYTSKYQHFYHYIYEPFRIMYQKVAEKNSTHTTGDAFLLYAKLYQITTGFDREKAEKVMPNLVIELRNYGDEENIEIQTSSETIPKQGLIGTLASIIAPKKIKVGFVYARTIASSGWTYSHDLGRAHIETYFKDQVSTAFIENVPEDDSAYQIISDFAQEGFDVIFSTSEIYRRVTLRCAIENPSIKFFSCSGNRPYVHLSNYFGRTYEPRFLAGIIAGAMTTSQIVGYTATDKSPEVTACINAFAMGMKMVNPRAKLLVALTGEWNNPLVTTDISEKLIDLGADIVSNKNIITPREVTKKYGIYAMLCDVDLRTKRPKHYLAAPIWLWGTFYQKIIESILTGSYQKLASAGAEPSRVITYWWGMESGVIDLYYAPEHIPAETVKLVEIMKKLIISDQYHPFSGPIYDQSGNLKVPEQTTLAASEILEMDWYMDNVEIVDTDRCYQL